VVEIRVIDAVVRLNRHVLDEQRGDLRSKTVMDVPDLHVANDKGMPRVRPGALHTFTQIESVQSLTAVHFVVFETHKREGADIDVGFAAVGLHDATDQLESAGRGGLVAEPIMAIRRRHVPRERVEAVSPPETSPFILVKRQHLLGQLLAGAGCDRQIAVKDVVDLGAVFQKEPVPDAAVAHTVADQR
jgi:hypothetical protein